MLINLYTNAGTIQVDSLRYTSIKKLIDLLDKYKIDSIKEVILFGSASRGFQQLT